MYQSDFYKNLDKPKITPPAIVFTIVWKVLYFLMAVSFVLLLMSPNTFVKAVAVFVFLVQLMLNFNWSCVFFVERNVKKAFLICLLLLLFVVWMTILFFKQAFWAGILQIPYCLWLILATYLNYYILRKN